MSFNTVTLPSAPIGFYTGSMLTGDWPVKGLVEANSYPRILEEIRQEANGSAITKHNAYFSLGLFYIDTPLLVQHAVQRPTTIGNVENLVVKLETEGIRREENPGAIIGLGEGWYNMKKNMPGRMLIHTTSPHLHHLQKTTGGPIGEVIRGGHRTAAIRNISAKNKNPGMNYWIYEVLVPGMCFNYMFSVMFIDYHDFNL